MSSVFDVPSVMVMSHVWSPTLASVIWLAFAVRVAVCASLPPSDSVIQSGHDPPLVLENVTSAPSSSVAVRVILSASSSVTLPASTAPAPSLLRNGASFTAVTVMTNVSVAVAVPSETVHVIA